jgi:hypothetical protein
VCFGGLVFSVGLLFVGRGGCLDVVFWFSIYWGVFVVVVVVVGFVWFVCLLSYLSPRS